MIWQREAVKAPIEGSNRLKSLAIVVDNSGSVCYTLDMIGDSKRSASVPTTSKVTSMTHLAVLLPTIAFIAWLIYRAIAKQPLPKLPTRADYI